MRARTQCTKHPTYEQNFKNACAFIARSTDLSLKTLCSEKMRKKCFTYFNIKCIADDHGKENGVQICYERPLKKGFYEVL